MTPADKIKLLLAAAKAAQIGFDIATGNREDAGIAARELMNLAVSMVPVDELKEFLTERDRNLAELAADVAEQIKIGSSIP